MIIQQLVLHDFGIYGGRHEIDLVPTDSGKPVILFGGLNGRGKTTMLDAINLALFGRRAALSNRRADIAWDRYLRESIHRGAPGGALVEMTFAIEDDFEVRTYQITRSWELSGKSVKEFFSVAVNGERDPVLTEDWDEHIEGILPIDIASLFFFDGEKIDKMADPEQSAGVIRSALKSLLGLGILEKLEGDLKVLLKRKQEEAISGGESDELLGLQEEEQALESRRAELSLEMASVKTQLDRSEEVLKRVQAQARSLGSDKWEQRVQLETNRTDLLAERSAAESTLTAMVEGSAPLTLIASLLRRTREQMEHDAHVYRSQLLLTEITERDKAILSRLPVDLRASVAPLLDEDREMRLSQAMTAVVHQSPDVGEVRISAALREILDNGEVAAVLSRLDDLDTRINEAERRLLSVPTEAQLGPVLESLGRARSTREALETQAAALSSEILHINNTLERVGDRLRRLREDEADRSKTALEDQRVREYTRRSIETVSAVAKSSIERNLSRVEAAIYQRFVQLIGKEDLITGILIDRDTLQLQVSTKEGNLVQIERLSAGERQLLATATLWGMATVAGRPIPLVIDTPLGRLDGDHRMNLVTRYFPHAAHQVVIFSTDSEIVGALYGALRPAVGRELLITYDERSQRSSVIPGYFTEVANAR